MSYLEFVKEWKKSRGNIDKNGIFLLLILKRNTPSFIKLDPRREIIPGGIPLDPNVLNTESK